MSKIDINKLLKGRQPKDIDELNRILQEEMLRLNDSPRREFCGVSPNQMRFLVYDPFAEGSSFGFRTFDPAVLDACPFFLLAEDMLRRTVLTNSPFALTTSTASLPVKVVKSLCEGTTLKDDWLDRGINHVSKETDAPAIHVCKIVLELSGVVRKQQKKWHLTKKGQKLVQPTQRVALFQELFCAFTMKYNWAYQDRYGHRKAAQIAFAFSISLLSHFGGVERKAAFYAQKYLTAFPMLIEECPPNEWMSPEREITNCFATRFFERFALYWGLAEISGPGDPLKLSENIVRKSRMLDQVFRVPVMKG